MHFGKKRIKLPRQLRRANAQKRVRLQTFGAQAAASRRQH
jgi:hypothetical protein